MNLLRYSVAAFCLGGSLVWAADPPPPPPPPPGAPLIDHAPVTTVVRGQPAHVVAKISGQLGATVVSVNTYVRLADVGNPIKYLMQGGPGDGTYDSEVPVSLIRAVQRFWYYIHAVDSAGRTNDTVWFPVNVIDGGGLPGGAGGALNTRNALIAGGILLGGATFAIIDHNQGGGGGGEPPAPPPAPPAPPAKKDPPKEKEGVPDPIAPSNVVQQAQPSDPTPPPCITTGSEVVNFIASSLNPFDPYTPIEVAVCYACTNASIRVTSSWGQEVTVSPYNNGSPSCDLGNVIQLTKPISAPSANTAWIQVFSNGSLIGSLTWPDSSWF